MAAQDLTGTTLGARYRITELLGAGGMGQVYAGLDETLERRVAIKVLLRKLADDARFRERFLREAKAASKIQHPNVVQIIDFGDTPGGSVFYAMEFLEGRDLAAVLRAEGPLPWSRARNILLQIVKALGATHDRKIIHRDIKPANFFVLEARGHRDFIKLIDFGIAKLASDPSQDDKSLALSLTGAGEVMGTAKYMAPEQAYGSSDDPRVDVYAVGVVAYEILTGTVPFKGGSVFEILKQHVDTPPRPPHELNPAIPAEVEAIVLRALAKDQQARFASMDEFEAALAAVPAEARSAAAGLGMSLARPAVPPSVAAPRTAVVDTRASNEAIEAARRGAVMPPVAAMPSAPPGSPAARAPRRAPPGGTAPVPPGRSAFSEVVTAPRPSRDGSPSSPSGSTMVVPTRPRVPSSVTHGQLGTELGAPAGAVLDPSSSALGSPTEGSASVPPPTRPSGESSSSGSTSRITTHGDVGAATGPTSSVAVGAETDALSLMGAAEPTPTPTGRGRGLVLTLVAAGVVVLSAVGAAALLSGDEGPEPSPTVATKAVESPSDASPPPAGAEAAELEVGAPAGGASSGEPEPSPEGVGEVPPEVAPVAEPDEPAGKPEPEPEELEEPSEAEPDEPEPEEPASKPKPKAKKSKPLTDDAVLGRLSRSLARSCRGRGGSGTVSVDLLVSSAGKVVTRSAPSASGDLRTCLLANVGGATFPKGSTRRVTVKVRF